MSKRTIIIGDAHGCIDEFNELIKTLQYNKSQDRLILLGDLIDRGPDSVGLIKLVRHMDIESVMGNHEFKFLKWLFKRHEHKIYQSYINGLNDDDIEFLKRMPKYIDCKDFIAVHAGVKPGIPISNQRKDDLLYLRYTDEYRNFISLKQVLLNGKGNAMFWTEFGPFENNIIYGHHVHSMENIQIDSFHNNKSCYGIDTGACFGGKLSAIIWETKEVVQVQSKHYYSKEII